jgi:hypothetical protein
MCSSLITAPGECGVTNPQNFGTGFQSVQRSADLVPRVGSNEAFESEILWGTAHEPVNPGARR